MTNEQLITEWVDRITAHNRRSESEWTVRFAIDGQQLVEKAVKGLDALHASIVPRGGPLEYLASFPSALARNVSVVLVEQGAQLCPDQTVPSEL